MEDKHLVLLKNAVPFCCALLVPFNLGPPKCTISSGNMAAVRATVPKTAVNEYRDPLFNKIKIRATGQRYV